MKEVHISVSQTDIKYVSLIFDMGETIEDIQMKKNLGHIIGYILEMGND